MHTHDLIKKPGLLEQIKTRLWNTFSSPADRAFDIADVSGWQTVKDASLIPQLQMAICKATEGTSYVSSGLEPHWKWIPEKAKLAGVYHYYTPGANAVHQAQHFLETVFGLTPSPDIIIADFDLPQITVTEAAEFMDALWSGWTLAQEKPCLPFWYTNGNILLYSFNKHLSLIKYPFWFAWPVDAWDVYPLNPPTKYVASDEWRMWQYLWKWSLPGIEGDVDRSQWNGTFEEMYEFIKGEPVEPPAPGECPNQARVDALVDDLNAAEKRLFELRQEFDAHAHDGTPGEFRVRAIEGAKRARTFKELNDHELSMNPVEKSYLPGEEFFVGSPKYWNSDAAGGKQRFCQILDGPRTNLTGYWVRWNDLEYLDV